MDYIWGEIYMARKWTRISYNQHSKIHSLKSYPFLRSGKLMWINQPSKHSVSCREKLNGLFFLFLPLFPKDVLICRNSNSKNCARTETITFLRVYVAKHILCVLGFYLNSRICTFFSQLRLLYWSNLTFQFMSSSKVPLEWILALANEEEQ